ncbi:protein-L-isoaspartate O-methyltransferase [Candidatus Pacearchaeota archaeon]|nr:protein-L-isoaspartate O-methyltransferase [Candidatus Pacearchaeota archaeon]
MEKEKQNLLESLRNSEFSEQIISAFEKVPRENFVPDHLKSYAYEDIALPIESGSTISQPHTVAFMLKLLDPKQNQKILEIGSGSGYALSLLSEVIKSGSVYGLEINSRLAVKSKSLLSKDSNICIFNKSGFSGLPDFAPFDRILFSASCQDMRIPYNLLEQLKDPGILVVPVKSSIFKVTKENGKTTEEEFPGFAFVPLRKEE